MSSSLRLRRLPLLGVVIAVLTPLVLLSPTIDAEAAAKKPKYRVQRDARNDVKVLDTKDPMCRSAARRNSVDVKWVDVDSRRNKQLLVMRVKMRDVFTSRRQMVQHARLHIVTGKGVRVYIDGFSGPGAGDLYIIRGPKSVFQGKFLFERIAKKDIYKFRLSKSMIGKSGHVKVRAYGSLRDPNTGGVCSLDSTPLSGWTRF